METGGITTSNPNPTVKFAPLRCAGTALKRSPLPPRWVLKLKALISALLLVWMPVAHAANYTHEPGGPFYFKTFITNFEETLTPTEEMTDVEAQVHAQKGASVYIAWFNAQGLISKIEKHLRGKRLMQVEYKYKDGRLSEKCSIDENGKETIRRY